MYFKSFKFKYDIKKHELCENKTIFKSRVYKPGFENRVFKFIILWKRFPNV